DRAQLQNQLGQGQSDLLASLGARGMGRSGARPTGNTSLQEQYQTTSNTALNSLLDSIRASVNDYGTLQSNAADKLHQARAQVAQRLSGLTGYSGETTSDYES